MSKLLIGFGLLSLILCSCGKTEACIDPNNIDYGVYCGQVYEPVCGCNDITYANPCEAETSGVRSYIYGPC